MVCFVFLLVVVGLESFAVSSERCVLIESRRKRRENGYSRLGTHAYE